MEVQMTLINLIILDKEASIPRINKERLPPLLFLSPLKFLN